MPSSRRMAKASHSLDLPVKRTPTHLPTLFETTCWMNDTNEDRYYLYLPRNLSFCHLCSEVAEQHTQRKIMHLNDMIENLNLGALTEPSASSGGQDSLNRDSKNKGQEEGLWISSHTDESPTSTKCQQSSIKSRTREPSSRPTSILRKTQRSKSYPPLNLSSPKKVVRFADSLGLELEKVRTVMAHDQEEPTALPASAFADLHQVENNLELEPDFQNPSSLVDFDFRLRRQCVCLFSVRPTYTNVYGLIRVLNLTFHKKVFVRYSANGWSTYNDTIAVYVPDSSNGKCDDFSFNVLTFPTDFYGLREIKLHFAVGFRTEDGREFWDNNEGKNYTLTGYYKPVSVNAHLKHSLVHFL